MTVISPDPTNTQSLEYHLVHMAIFYLFQRIKVQFVRKLFLNLSPIFSKTDAL